MNAPIGDRDVGVETPVALRPLRRSQRADCPHWALASGPNAEAPERIGVKKARRGQSALTEPLHPSPGGAPPLAAPGQNPVPETLHLTTERERPSVHRHPVILQVAENDRAQPRAHHRNRVVQAAPEFGFHLPQLRLQPLPHRLPEHRKPPIPRLPADVREAEKVERLRLPQAGALPVVGRRSTEFQQARLLRVQLEAELCEPLALWRSRSQMASARVGSPM